MRERTTWCVLSSSAATKGSKGGSLIAPPAFRRTSGGVGACYACQERAWGFEPVDGAVPGGSSRHRLATAQTASHVAVIRSATPSEDRAKLRAALIAVGDQAKAGEGAPRAAWFAGRPTDHVRTLVRKRLLPSGTPVNTPSPLRCGA